MTPIETAPSNADTFRMTALSEQPLEKTLMALMNKESCAQSQDPRSDAQPKQEVETRERLDTIYNDAMTANEPMLELKESSLATSRSTFQLF